MIYSRRVFWGGGWGKFDLHGIEMFSILDPVAWIQKEYLPGVNGTFSDPKKIDIGHVESLNRIIIF